MMANPVPGPRARCSPSFLKESARPLSVGMGTAGSIQISEVQPGHRHLAITLISFDTVSTGTRENVAVGETAVGAEIRISLLGGFSVGTAGKPIDDHWRLRKAKTLVKLLALAPGHWLTRDAVIEILWADAQPAGSQSMLISSSEQLPSHVPPTTSPHCVKHWRFGLARFFRRISTPIGPWTIGSDWPKRTTP